MTGAPSQKQGFAAPPVAVTVAVVGLLLLGGFAWWITRLEQQRRYTKKILEQTEAALDAKNKAFDGLEEQRQQLGNDYDTLKTRWNKTEDELSQARVSAERTQTELAATSQQRLELQARLNETEQRDSGFRADIQRLKQQMQEHAQRSAVLEQQLQSQAAGLTRAELEQVAEKLVGQQHETVALDERMQALSHAFEELAWKHIELQELTGQGAPAGDIADTWAAAPSPQAKKEAAMLAARFRRMGEFCMASYQYPQAAEAFERSLAYKDDPAVHTALAFLYGRLWPNPDKAGKHAAFASPGYAAKQVLDPTTKAQGLPRKTRHLVWDWLTR